jgi:hypothetical protein
MDLLMGIPLDGEYLFKQFMSHKEKNSMHFSKFLKKDLECCLGVIQTHCAIIQNPSRQWDMATIKSVIIGGVISHNIIREYESNCNIKPLFDIGTNGSHLKWGCFLKIIAKKPLRLKMHLSL